MNQEGKATASGIVCRRRAGCAMGRFLAQSNPGKLLLPTVLRALEVTKIKIVPYVPLSHPFVERLIGTVRREFSTGLYSGQRQIWRRNYSISNTTIMGIEPMLGWMGARRNHL